jgi:hypothetical protein
MNYPALGPFRRERRRVTLDVRDAPFHEVHGVQHRLGLPLDDLGVVPLGDRLAHLATPVQAPLGRPLDEDARILRAFGGQRREILIADVDQCIGNSLANLPLTVLAPQESYEGAELALAPSRSGPAPGRVRQRRDPGIFQEAGKTWLLYSVAGESGIAMAELKMQDNTALAAPGRQRIAGGIAFASATFAMYGYPC